MSLVERVAETLQIDPHRDSWEQAEAVLEALGLVTCQTCGGKGWTDEPHPSGAGGFRQPCSECEGLGVVSSEAMIERTTTGLGKHPDLYEIGSKDLQALEQLGFKPAKVKNEYIVKDVLAALLEAFGGDDE